MMQIERSAADRGAYLLDKLRNPRFDYLGKLFRQGGRDALRDLVAGNARAPLVVDFDPTTACNFSCPECISADLLNKDKIPSERIDELMREFAAAGVQGIVFIGGGEPLAHACMPKPIRQAYELGMSVGLTTNGSLIPRHLGTLAECCHWTRVSMDAGSEKTFLIFRPNKIKNSFNLIVKGMEDLAKAKQGALGYSFVLMNRLEGGKLLSNASEVYEAARLAKSIGCDYFELKPMLDMHHSLIPFAGRTADVVREELEKATSLCGDGFDVVTTASIFHMERNTSTSQVKTYHTCPTMELRTTVTPSGIYPCAYHRGREDLKLGTVYDGPFNVFWISDERREAAAKVDPTEHCSFYCARHRMNQVVLSLADLKREGIDLLSYIREVEVLDVFI
ncbi:MAG: radical SAM protein [Pseudomonadota bacterium]